MIEARFLVPSEWQPAGAFSPMAQAVIQAMVTAGVVRASLELEDGGAIEVRRSEED